MQQKSAQDHLKASMEKRKAAYDKKTNFIQYKRGDQVLCRSFVCKPGLKPKLLRERWTGPWIIDKIRGPVNYRIVRKDQRGKQVRVLPP